MWADAQRKDGPAEYRWRPLRKFRNSIPCTTPQSLAEGHCSSAVQSHCQYRRSKFTLRPPSLALSYWQRYGTARHSSSGREPNFAALSTGRHLYSAGRPSRWALAHILVIVALWNRADHYIFILWLLLSSSLFFFLFLSFFPRL